MAQINLGGMYDQGQGVVQSFKEALVWYRKAADQGYAKAQLNLGVKYAHGQGVARNLETALVWFQKAAAQGDSEAKKYATMAEEHLRAPRTASQPQQQRKVGNHQCAACGAASGPGGTALKPCGRSYYRAVEIYSRS